MDALRELGKEPPPVGKDEKRVLLVDRPGATQSYVAVTTVGVPRKNPDFDALMVMNSEAAGPVMGQPGWGFVKSSRREY